MSLTSADISRGMTGASEGGAPASSALLGRRAIRLALVGCFALLTWLGAKIAVPLPGTPVPGTLQTLAVLRAGAFLGARAGAGSQAVYILMGAAGLPVFALAGAGPFYLLGPTGGYLFGFVAAAFLVGVLLSGRASRGVLGSGAAFLSGAAIIHVFGVAWLAVVLGDPAAAVRAGVSPFILFDLAKVVVAAGIYAGYLRWKPDTRP